MIEWCASSFFSFLEGVSSPEELIRVAHALGYQGLGLADRMGQYGQVQALRTRNLLQAEAQDDKHQKDNEPLGSCDSLTNNMKGPPYESVSENSKTPATFFYAPGIRLHFEAADPLLVYPLHKASYGELCKFLSAWALEGMSHGEKGLTPLPWKAFKDFLKKCKSSLPLDSQFILISVNGRFYPWALEDKTKGIERKEKKLQTRVKKSEVSRLQAQEARPAGPSFANPPTAPGFCPLWLLELRDLCGKGPSSALSLAYPLTFSPGCEDLCNWLAEQSRTLEIPLLATSIPLYATQKDQDLCDLVHAIRHTCELKDLGYLAQANGERRLLNENELHFHKKRVQTLFNKGHLFNDPFQRGIEISQRHHFSLTELHYTYPKENIPENKSPATWLRELVLEGAVKRYGLCIPEKVKKQIEHELSLIGKFNYEDYFLTIWDILKYARSKKILFQGRGSAANSVICYCLEITAIDPVMEMDLLFERFISLERHQPPDIDVDFEHERREEVMQEVYRRYGRDKASMVASYICFQTRMAFREASKALGLNPESLSHLSKLLGREGLKNFRNQKTEIPKEVSDFLKEHKISLRSWQRVSQLAPRLVGIPRHLGLHTGGFILASNPLTEQCVLEPARKENRSVVPWNKDDVDYLKWMKVDLLSLGMLTAIRKCFDLIANTSGKQYELYSVPQEVPKVYEHLSRADTVGVFQIESRAQMNMLPRFVPKNFYDITIEVAIVRPGPLQGGMVHPYLRRRQGLEPVTYDHPALESILGKTLGIPIFQEQVMKMVGVVANFTPGESDQLRKVMSGAWRSKSNMHKLKDKLLTGMKQNGISGEFAERVYKQIEGFGEYGFPESHAASFAKITYVSCYLKYHYPAEFVAALLNSQPMGFYSPRALLHDAERHGVKVLPIDLYASKWDCTLEDNPRSKFPAVRMGFRLIRGFFKEEAAQIEELQRLGILSSEHEHSPSIEDLHLKAGVSKRSLEKLIRAGALISSPSNDSRRGDLWQFLSLKNTSKNQLSLASHPSQNQKLPTLEKLSAWESLLQDYEHSGIVPSTLAARSSAGHYHPAQFAREEFFPSKNWWTAEELFKAPANKVVRVIGLVGNRQKPPTAGGLVFVTLEDESGFFNLVIMPDVYTRTRMALEHGRILAAEGVIQRSAQSNPNDLYTVALSLKVSKLWNPFLNGGDAIDSAAKRAHPQEPMTKSRNWH